MMARSPDFDRATWTFAHFLSLKLDSLCRRRIPGKGTLPIMGSTNPALLLSLCFCQLSPCLSKLEPSSYKAQAVVNVKNLLHKVDH